MKPFIVSFFIACLFNSNVVDACLKKNSSKKATKVVGEKKPKKALSKRELREEINKKWWENLYSDFAVMKY